MRWTDIRTGQEVAVWADRKWRDRPDTVRPARVVDVGPFVSGLRRTVMTVDGEEVTTYYSRRAASSPATGGGLSVAIRYTDPLRGEIPIVEFVATQKLIDTWPNWNRIRAELEATRAREARVLLESQAEALAVRQARRQAVADLLAARGVTVSTYRDFDEEDRVVLSEKQVRKLVG